MILLSLKQAIAIILVLIFITSCREQDSFVETRLKTADKFIECLKNNTPDRILEYTYPDVDHKINDKEFRDFYVNKASEFIRKFWLPSKDKWIIKHAQ